MGSKLVITEVIGEHESCFDFYIKGSNAKSINKLIDKLIENWYEDSDCIINFDTNRTEYVDGRIVTWEVYPDYSEEEYTRDLLNRHIRVTE